MMMNNPAHAGGLVGLKEEGQAIMITELSERIKVTRHYFPELLTEKHQ